MCNVQGTRLDGFVITGGSAETGGGVRASDCDQTNSIVNCSITRNFSSFRGGGIELIDSHNVIENCLITENTIQSFEGGSGGAGLSLVNSNARVRNSTISDNEMDQTRVSNLPGGAGVKCLSGAPLLEDCLISGNILRVNW